MGNYLTSATGAEKHVRVKPARRSTNNDKGRPEVQLEDLPEVLCSNCQLFQLTFITREAVRCSVLSTQWRYIWTACPRLCFNGAKLKQRTQIFIDLVNAVLQEHRAKLVDDLEVKIVFESKLTCHLNSLITFALSSQTKSLAFDLAPPTNVVLGYRDHYRFPFELLDKENVSCLQCLQLSSLSLKSPPAQFTGFPNLRKLDIHLLNTNTSRQDLENVLCSCCNLEWLSLVRCHLDEELKVVRRPLSHLMYLQVMYCRITKVEFHVPKLSTFVYKGESIPIVLHHASELENTQFCFYGSTFQRRSTSILDGLPDVQNLTLEFSVARIEARWMLDSYQMFSNLRTVQMKMVLCDEDDDGDRILYLVSLLRAAPFIENMGVHISAIKSLWFSNNGPSRQEIPPSEHRYLNLKNMHLTGFKAAKGQLEFLLHVVENAPSIETVTVDTTERLEELVNRREKVNPSRRSSALDLLRPLSTRLPPGAKLYLL